MGVDEHARERRLCLCQALLDPLRAHLVEAHECLGGCFPPKQSPQQPHAGNGVVDRIRNEIDEHDRDAGGFEPLHHFARA